MVKRNKVPPKAKDREKLVERLAAQRPWEMVAAEPYDASNLDESHRWIVDDLEEAAQKMSRLWAGKSYDEIMEDHESFERDSEEFEAEIKKAIHAKLKDHPVVQAYLSDARSVAERTKLRDIRRGLETGIPQTMRKGTFWIIYEAAGQLEVDSKEAKPSIKDIRRRLVRQLTRILREEETLPDFFAFKRDDILHLRKRIQNLSNESLRQLFRRHGLPAQRRA